MTNYGGIRPLQAKWGLNLLNPNLNNNFLEISFGLGYIIHAIARTIKDFNSSGKVFGIDHSKIMVDDALKRNEEYIQDGIVELKYAEADKLPYPDKMFDTCVVVNNLNFWSEVSGGISEIYRVLNKEGRFLFLESIFKQDLFPERIIKGRAAGAVIYEKEEFLQFIKTAGFKECTLYLKKKWQFLAIIAKK